MFVCAGLYVCLIHSEARAGKYEVVPGPIIIAYVTYCPLCSLMSGETQHTSVTTSYFPDLVFLFPVLVGEDTPCRGVRYSL